MIGRTITTFIRGRRGTAAAEYALVLPASLFLALGVFNLAVVLSAISGLNRTTEAAARYASVQTALTGADPGSTAVAAWATSNYAGPNVNAAFTYTATGCGHTVQATGTYALVTGFSRVPLNLTANACFP